MPHVLDLDEDGHGDRPLAAIQDGDVGGIIEWTTGDGRAEDDGGLAIVRTLSRVATGGRQ